MREAILVAHPAPVRHVPKGGRHERTSIARIATPAMLSTLDRDAFEPLPRLKEAGFPVAIRDGRLWAPLRHDRDGHSEALSPDAFRSFLRGDMDRAAPEFDPLVSRFRRSPLVAQTTVMQGKGEFYAQASIGAPLDTSGSRGIPYDGREACAREAARFVGEDFAIVDSEVWARIRPLAQYRHDGTDHSLSPLTHPHGLPTGGLHIGLGRLQEGVSAFRNTWDRQPAETDGLRRLIDALPKGVGSDDDISYLANLLPREIVYRSHRTHDVIRTTSALEAMMPALRIAELAGMTGRIADDEAPEVLRLVHRAIGEVLDNRIAYQGEWFLARARKHLDISVMERIRTLPQDDVEDLAGLAP